MLPGSDFFGSEAGVRQGCILAPLLYSIFINGLAKVSSMSGLGASIDEEECIKLASLLYAVMREKRIQYPKRPLLKAGRSAVHSSHTVVTSALVHSEFSTISTPSVSASNGEIPQE